MNNRLLSFGGKKALARAEGRGTMTEDGGQKTEGRQVGISNIEPRLIPSGQARNIE